MMARNGSLSDRPASDPLNPKLGADDSAPQSGRPPASATVLDVQESVPISDSPMVDYYPH